MANPAEAAQPLFVEQELVDVTEYRSNRSLGELWGNGLKYPKHLGSLAVGYLRFDPDYDVGRITDGVKTDFTASYEIDDPNVADTIRQRSMNWLDWLAQETNLNAHSLTYIGLAAMAAKHSDAETVRQIVEDPKRLWFDKHAGVSVSDPSFGQLDRLSSDSIGSKIYNIAGLLTAAPEEHRVQMQAAVMPTLQDIIAEFASRDLTDKGFSIEWTGAHLLTLGTPEALEQLDTLVDALPMTPARLDVLVKLAERNERFAAAAAEAIAWHQEKAGLAEQCLTEYMKPYGTARNIIDFPKTRFGKEDAVESQPIAAAIVDQIPVDNDGTSAIETSVAYAHGSMFGGSVHGNILQCVRALTGNPHFKFAEPQFGFAARFESGERSYAHGQVTVVDANLPEGRMVIDLSGEPFWSSVAFDDTRFLCRILQAEKNRRATTV